MKKLGWLSIICLLFLLLPVSALAKPVLVAPTSGQVFYENPPTLYWQDNRVPWGYTIEISDQPYFNSAGNFIYLLFSYEVDLYTKQINLQQAGYKLPYGTYYWHVSGLYPSYDFSTSYREYSLTWSFQLKQTPPPPPALQPQPPAPKPKTKTIVAKSFHAKVCKKDKKYHAKHCKVSAKLKKKKNYKKLVKAAKQRHKKKCTKVILK